MSGARSAPIDRVIAIDWSGARDAAGVWLAEVVNDAVTRLEPAGSRERAVALVAAAAREGPRLAAGFDFAFSYPAWFVAERGCADAFALWDLVARAGEGWLAAPAYPFWVLRTRAQGEVGVRAFRQTDRAMAGARVSPKSVFQLSGPGQVGTMSIRGIPLLRELRAAGLAVWPFEDPGAAQSVAVEIYPRRYYGDAVVKGDADARRAYLDDARARITDAQRAACVRNDHAFDAVTAALAMWNGRAGLATLPSARDAVERVEGRIWAPEVPPRAAR